MVTPRCRGARAQQPLKVVDGVEDEEEQDHPRGGVGALLLIMVMGALPRAGRAGWQLMLLLMAAAALMQSALAAEDHKWGQPEVVSERGAGRGCAARSSRRALPTPGAGGGGRNLALRNGPCT